MGSEGCGVWIWFGGWTGTYAVGVVVVWESKGPLFLYEKCEIRGLWGEGDEVRKL